MISVRRESENGVPIAYFDAAGIDVRIVKEAPATSSCLRFIDPYGNLVINQLQLSVLISELEEMRHSTPDTGFRKQISRLIEFLNNSIGVHIYVRFIGD
jgi:hypothetical protein